MSFQNQAVVSADTPDIPVLASGTLAGIRWVLGTHGGGLRLLLGSCKLTFSGRQELQQARTLAEALLRAVTDKERGA